MELKRQGFMIKNQSSFVQQSVNTKTGSRLHEPLTYLGPHTNPGINAHSRIPRFTVQSGVSIHYNDLGFKFSLSCDFTPSEISLEFRVRTLVCCCCMCCSLYSGRHNVSFWQCLKLGKISNRTSWMEEILFTLISRHRKLSEYMHFYTLRKYFGS